MVARTRYKFRIAELVAKKIRIKINYKPHGRNILRY
jgi:hypothetical protein